MVPDYVMETDNRTKIRVKNGHVNVNSSDVSLYQSTGDDMMNCDVCLLLNSYAFCRFVAMQYQIDVIF